MNEPFLLRPVGKDYLWGGSRLNDDFSKEIAMHPLAETWECSTHPDGESIVKSGLYKNELLTQVIRLHPEYIGKHPRSLGLPDGQLPILIKLIDASSDLSIQVHPDDKYAKIHENGQFGKTEMWYVLDAEKDSKLVYGLLNNVEKDRFKRDVEKGVLEKHLQFIPVKKNDVFFIKAGIIHAIGKGLLIVEIQENSNLTYRIYDYDRVDKKGKKRKLHIDKALEVACLNSAESPRQPFRILKYRPGCALELLCRCKYFEVSRMLINTERCRSLVRYQTDQYSFHLLMCIDGCGSLSFNSEALNFFKGDCIFVPANSVKIKIHGICVFLDVRS